MPRKPPADFPPPVLITDTASPRPLCARLRAEPFVTIDTEFMRERTYYPELCVVQLAGENDVAVIDAEAPGIDLAPPRRPPRRPGRRQSLPRRPPGRRNLPRAASAPSRSRSSTPRSPPWSPGSATRSATTRSSPPLTGGQIDKAHRFSDWSARPLSPSQVAYAAADVTYLRLVYTSLVRPARSATAASNGSGRRWRSSPSPSTYRADPETLWERLRPRTNNRRMLGLLRAAVAWREREAQRINIPRQRLIKDESLLEIAAVAPTTPGRARPHPRRHPRLRRGPHRRRPARRPRGSERPAGGPAARRARAPATAPARPRRWSRC